VPVEEKTGFAICRTTCLDGWGYIADHRGETVYDTETGQPVEITGLGGYLDNVTTIEPLTPYDRWNGSKWVTDADAQKGSQVAAAKQKKSSLLAEAKGTISMWQTELQLGIISDDDKVSLITWMKYIQALSVIDISASPDIEWPIKPE